VSGGWEVVGRWLGGGWEVVVTGISDLSTHCVRAVSRFAPTARSPESPLKLIDFSLASFFNTSTEPVSGAGRDVTPCDACGDTVTPVVIL
jgi:hypothetical protein